MSILQEKHSKENRTEFENSSARTALEKLGFDEWFESKSKEYKNSDFSIARIVEVNKNNFKINDGRYVLFAELSGKFLFTTENSLDYPTVGDWVVAQCFDAHSPAIFHHILPR